MLNARNQIAITSDMVHTIMLTGRNMELKKLRRNTSEGITSQIKNRKIKSRMVDSRTRNLPLSQSVPFSVSNEEDGLYLL
jgi:hypothetical protein